MIHYIKNTKKWLMIFSVFLFSLSACEMADDFLEEPPSKTTAVVVTEAHQLDALLNRYFTFNQEGNSQFIFGTDDYGLTVDLFDARPATFSHMTGIWYMLWDIEHIPFQNNTFWNNEWTKVFNANMVLNNLERVNGTEEEKAILRADAHLIRAYSYFQLVNTFCLPLTPATADEPGLPIKRSTSFEEDLTRSSLEQTYEFIEEDIEEALKTTVPLVQNGVARHWRSNIAAANGFAARYWLVRNDYTQALTHAEAALNEYDELVDYNTEMYYGTPNTITIRPPGEDPVSVTVEYPYTHDDRARGPDNFEWKEFMYFRMLYHSGWWFIPSLDLLSLYDQENDLRYKYHIVENYSYDRGMTDPAYEYPGYIFFFKDHLPSGPTTAEMLLIKAEAQARLGQVGPAMTTLNRLYSSRTRPGTPELTAANQDDAIRVVLEERRREMPFTQRWTDIRRFNTNDYALDVVNLERTFYPYSSSNTLHDEAPQSYTLPSNSRRWAAPLPFTEIDASQGVLEQNTY